MSQNENCLEGVACPACGQNDKFHIQATVTALVTDDGAEALNGGFNWDNDSWCRCPNCKHAASLGTFRIKEPEGQ